MRTGTNLAQVLRDKPTLAYLSPPVVQQARVNVVPRCNFTHAGTRLLRLRHYAQLLLQTPATTTLPAANNLNHAVQHRLKLDLTVRFKADSSAHPSVSEKAGLTRR